MQMCVTNFANSSNHEKHVNSKKIISSEPPTHTYTRLAIPAHGDGEQYEGQWKARSMDTERAATSPEIKDVLLFMAGAQHQKYEGEGGDANEGWEVHWPLPPMT
jgi:hypothetical protein